jgi:hypothetical protein
VGKGARMRAVPTGGETDIADREYSSELQSLLPVI